MTTYPTPGWNKIFIICLVLLSAWLIYLLAPILTPFLIGILLAYLVNPLVKKLVRHRIPRLLSVILIFSLLFLVVIFLVILLAPLIQTQLNRLMDMLPFILNWIQKTLIPWASTQWASTQWGSTQWGSTSTPLGSASTQWGIPLPDITTVKKTLTDQLNTAGNTVGHFIHTVFHSGFVFVETLVKLMLIPVVTFYLLLDWNKIILSVRGLLPRSLEPTLVRLIQECNTLLSAFFRGQLLVMMILGSVYAIALSLSGLHIGILLGIVIGLLSIVPYLGVMTGIIAASIAGWIQFNHFSNLLLIWGIFVACHLLEHTYLTPKLVGNRIGLHPVAVIFAILAGGKLFGFFGVLLALPAAAVSMVWLRFLLQHYKASEFYTSPFYK